jgi:hypothetical protein
LRTPANRLTVGDGTERNVRSGGLESVFAQAGIFIEHCDGMTLPDQAGHQRRARETQTSGDEYAQAIRSIRKGAL